MKPQHRVKKRSTEVSVEGRKMNRGIQIHGWGQL